MHICSFEDRKSFATAASTNLCLCHVLSLNFVLSVVRQLPAPICVCVMYFVFHVLSLNFVLSVVRQLQAPFCASGFNVATSVRFNIL